MTTMQLAIMNDRHLQQQQQEEALTVAAAASLPGAIVLNGYNDAPHPKMEDDTIVVADATNGKRGQEQERQQTQNQ